MMAEKTVQERMIAKDNDRRGALSMENFIYTGIIVVTSHGEIADYCSRKVFEEGFSFLLINEKLFYF